MADPKVKQKSFVETIVEQIVSKAVLMFTEPVLNYTSHLCTKASVFLGDFDENMTKLALDREVLRSTGRSLEDAVSIELRKWSDKKPSGRVEAWHGEESLIAKQATELIRLVNQEEGRACLGKCCVVRFRYGKRVVTCWEALSKLKDEGCKLMEDEKALTERAPPSERGRLKDFRNKCRNLRSVIGGIEELKAEVQRKFGQGTEGHGAHRVKRWFRDVEAELRESRSCASAGERHLENLKELGGSESSCSMVKVNIDIENEVSDCIERIEKHHGDGEEHLNTLSAAAAAGPSAINNEIYPVPPAVYVT